MTNKAQRYHVLHETRYSYSGEVVNSRQLLHLAPRVSPFQTIHTQSLTQSPEPNSCEVAQDAFGNPITRLEYDRLHSRLEVVSRMDVAVASRPNYDAKLSLPCSEVIAGLRYHIEARSAEVIDACRYRTESPYVRIKHTFGEYADDCLQPETPILVGAEALMRKIYEEFTYAPGDTVIATPLLEVLEKKRGVCQDFAHLMIACLRTHGLAARYVSGYLRTEPPKGMPRLIGADASHAWVSVWCPPYGWVDLDPTNGVRVNRDHITLAWGRDFGDVSPLRGVILGGGTHTLKVSVTVTPY